jgi:hypothetical protein
MKLAQQDDRKDPTRWAGYQIQTGTWMNIFFVDKYFPDGDMEI